MNVPKYHYDIVWASKIARMLFLANLKERNFNYVQLLKVEVEFFQKVTTLFSKNIKHSLFRHFIMNHISFLPKVLLRAS